MVQDKDLKVLNSAKQLAEGLLLILKGILGILFWIFQAVADGMKWMWFGLVAKKKKTVTIQKTLVTAGGLK